MSSSKSSQQSNASQTTVTPSVDGVNTGQIVQAGGAVTLNQPFSQEVADVFNHALNLLGDTLDIAAGAGQAAIESISKDKDQQSNPEISLARDYLPVFVLAASGLVVYSIFRK